LIVLRPFGKVLWLERALKEEPYWWHLDADGNKCRSLLSVELGYDYQSPCVSLEIIYGQYRITLEIKRGTDYDET